VHEERRREEVAQEPEAGDDGRERVRLGNDVEELYLEHVTGLHALHEERTRQRVHRAGVHARHGRLGGGWTELAIDAVARLQHHFLSEIDLEDRLDAGVKPIVSSRRLLGESLRPIDLDALHGVTLSPWRNRGRATEHRA
jgi:hypothetical protein